MLGRLENFTLLFLTEPLHLQDAHALYGSRLDIVGQGRWMGDFQKPGDIELFEMDEQECLDIDTQEDFNMIDALWKSGWRP